jgi:hypothetical protein
MPKDVKFRLSRQHEADLHDRLGGHISKSSGNQWHDPADGRHDPYDELSFAWDGKCALPQTQSMSFSRKDLAKIREQARGRKPMMAFRFYDTERGQVAEDWALIQIDELDELMALAKECLEWREVTGG